MTFYSKYSLFKTILFLVGFISLLSCQKEKNQADLILKNAKIYTADSSFSTAEAVAIKDGKIIAVGTNQEIQQDFEAKKEEDFTGKFIFPGFYDAHCHFYRLGQTLSWVDLVGATSYDEIITRVEKFAKEKPELSKDWILGRGWDQNDWEIKEFPTKEKLDALFPDKPIMLTRVDGHAVLVNQKALDLAGITAETVVDGGKVILVNGKPTGILIDRAIELLEKAIPEPSDKAIEQMLLEAQKVCFEKGLTNVVDAGLPRRIIDKIEEMQESGKLKMQVYAMIDPVDKDYYLNEKGTYETDKLNVRSFKVYADGALGSRGAALIQPYSDDSHNHGLVLTSVEEMEQLFRNAYDKGFQVNTHCIGDSANRLILDLYGKVLKGKNDRRWRIEHSQVVSKEDLDKYGEFSIIPSVQPTHATSDMYWAGDRLGEERVKTAYAYKDLLAQNGLLAFGSDFPVEAVNPIFGFHSAVARTDAKNYPEGGFQMENSVSRETALKAMTIWAAYSSFEEKERGSIEVGKQANFTILQQNILEMDEKKMRDVNVEAVYVNGEKVYEMVKR
ncbi:MAG: putative amidohydrolase YtcJ [Arenicella sp.]|jgi:predicted amidohydrolase YtcJ